MQTLILLRKESALKISGPVSSKQTAIFYRKKVLDSFHQDDIKEVKKTINNFFKYSIQSFQLKDH